MGDPILANIVVINFILKRLVAEAAMRSPTSVAARLLDDREDVVKSLLDAVREEAGEEQARATEIAIADFIRDAARLRG